MAERKRCRCCGRMVLFPPISTNTCQACLNECTNEGCLIARFIEDQRQFGGTCDNNEAR